jgi:hypothetical protein
MEETFYMAWFVFTCSLSTVVILAAVGGAYIILYLKIKELKVFVFDPLSWKI